MNSLSQTKVNNPYLSEKVLNRKPLGRHITKGNFDEINGGPDLEAIQLTQENPEIYSFETEFDDEFDHWTEHDFLEQHAAFQHDFRTLNPDAPITSNLLGPGNEVFDLVCDSDKEIDKLRKEFEQNLKISTFSPTEPKTESESNFEEILQSFQDSCARFGSFTEQCLDWKIIVPFIFLLQIFSISLLYFVGNLIVIATVKLGFFLVHQFKSQKNPIKPESNVTKSVSENLKMGKDMLLRAFQNEDGKILSDSKSDLDVKMVSVSSDTSLSSKAFVQGSLKSVNFPKPPPSVMSETELEVPVYDKRAYLNVTFNKCVSINALLDIGATSNSCNSSILNQIESNLGYKVPRLKRKFPVYSFGHSNPQEQECVVLDIEVESADGSISAKRVPFLVNEADSKVMALLGTSILNHWGATIDLGKTKTIVSFKSVGSSESSSRYSADRKSIKVVTSNKVTMFPMETRVIKAKIDGNFNPEFKEFICNPDFGEDSGIASNSFLFEKGGNEVMISATNVADTPITIDSDFPIGEVSVFDQNAFSYDKSIEGLIEKAHFVKSLPRREIKCYCDFKVDRSVPIIIFTDEYNISPHFNQLTAGDLSLREYKDMKSYRIEDQHIIYIKPRNGAYPFSWIDLSKRIKTEVRVVLSFRQELTSKEKQFLDKLSKKDIFIQLYFVKNISCNNCGSLANRYDPHLFRNIDGYKIFLIKGKTQVYDFQRLKDVDSPMIEMKIGFYCFLKCYRSQGKLIIFVHFTNWHDRLHKFRVENTVYTLYAHLRILRIPQKGVILTSWDDMSSFDSRQIKEALSRVEPWEKSSEFKIEEVKSPLHLAPFIISKCGCDSCVAIISFKNCPVVKAVMVFSGKLENLDNSTRIRSYSSGNYMQHKSNQLNDRFDKVGMKLLEVMESKVDKILGSKDISSELSSVKNSSTSSSSSTIPHPDDQPDWHGQEEIKEAMNQYCGEFDENSIMRDRHVPKPWRDMLPEDSLDRLGSDLKKETVRILDRFNDMFSHNKLSWRYMRNIEPLDLEFIHDNPVVARPMQMSPIKDRILTAKITNLIEQDLVKIIDHDKHYVTNISNIFLVPHNSQCKRDEITGKHDPNQIDDIDETKFRAVVDLRPTNATIKNPKQLDYIIESTTELLNRMAPFSAFILMDISSAYRSYPVTERTARRFCFRANTNSLRNKLLCFTSLPDGVSVAPSVFQKTFMSILEPIQSNCLIWIDDVLLMANSKSECLKIWEKALELLAAHNALISLKKLVLLEDTFEYLGLQVTVTPDGPVTNAPESKREVFRRLEEPKDKPQIKRILGLCCFLDQHIPGLHHHIAPLTSELKGAVPKPGKNEVVLNERQKRSFEKLKVVLDNIPNVFLFRYDRTAYLVSDASFTAAGAVLFQLNPDGKRLINGFYSKRFSTLVTCQKSSIFKEILALFFAINHFHRPYLMGAIKTVLIVDLSSIIGMLSATYDAVDPALSRLAFKLFNYNFCFQLRHAPSNADIVMSDSLSRLHGEPISASGLPINQTKDAEQFFKDYKKKIPEKWLKGAIFSYQDMLEHLTSEILKDPKISENVRQKRFKNLMQQIDEKWHPPILEIVKDGKDTSTYETKPLNGKDVNVSVLQCKAPEQFVDIQSAQPETSKKLSPPRTIKTLTIAHISKLQHEDEQCAKVIHHLMTVPFENQDKKFKKRFRLCNSNLLITRKNPKRPWDEMNVRIYLPIPAAMYVLAYMHLVSAHLGQNYLAQYFAATYRCFNMTKLVRIVVKSCSHCSIYEHKGVKYVKPGRLPRASRPSERCYMDILQIPPGKLHNKTFKYILGLIDDFSGFLTLIPLKDQTTKTVLHELGKLWSTVPPPSVIITDNAKYFLTPKFKEPLLGLGVKKVLTTSPNHSTSNSRIERAFKTVRRILFLNLSCFKRESHWDVFYSSICQYNNTPSWRLAKYSNSRIPPTPMELFFSQPCEGDILSQYLGHLSPFQQQKYHDTYKKIISDFEADMQKKHELEIKHMQVSNAIAPGDIVMVMNPKRIHHEVEAKGKELYLRDLWEVVEINKAKATLSPLFFKSRKSEKVYLDHLKKYEPQMMVQLLPEEMQDLMGHYHSPELMKRTKRPPSIVERRVQLRNFPELRNRIAPADNHSMPAIRGPLYEDDDFSDYDDPMFPKPGPEYTQIKYDNQHLVLPEDPNLVPHGNAPNNQNVLDDVHDNNDHDEVPEPEGEVQDGDEDDLQNLGAPALPIEDPFKTPENTRARPDEFETASFHKHKFGEVPNARQNQRVTFSPKSTMRLYKPSNLESPKKGNFSERLKNKIFGDFKARQAAKAAAKAAASPKDFKQLAKAGPSILKPFAPQFESSPTNPAYQYLEGNAWNQFSPIGQLQNQNNYRLDSSSPNNSRFQTPQGSLEMSRIHDSGNHESFHTPIPEYRPLRRPFSSENPNLSHKNDLSPSKRTNENSYRNTGASPKLRNQQRPSSSPQNVQQPLPQSTHVSRPTNQTLNQDMDDLAEGFGKFSVNSPNSKNTRTTPKTSNPFASSRASNTSKKTTKDSQKKTKSPDQANDPPKQSKYGRKYKKPNRLTYD